MRSVRFGPEKSALNLTTEMGLEHASKERGRERECECVCGGEGGGEGNTRLTNLCLPKSPAARVRIVTHFYTIYLSHDNNT